MSSFSMQPDELKRQIKQWGLELGFADVGITDTDLSAYETAYFNWIGEHFHGDMAYMARHGTKRTRPMELEPGTLSIISVRMNYLPPDSASPLLQLHDPSKAYVSRYALGKDYHKLMRKRLQQLAKKIEQATGPFAHRAFCDSAPVLERPIAEKAGLGFTGKNSLTIHPRAGSWFFLGELYTHLPLPSDPPFEKQGCGPCRACLDECPTGAIVDNGVVDSRRCISYLTIEFKGSIPVELRSAMGNRIYGCDDCQLVCPWNKFTAPTVEAAFYPRHDLDQADLLTLWKWTEEEFLKRFEGSPIRRIGYEQWRRNLAVALGNLPAQSSLIEPAIQALQAALGQLSPLVDEHIDWALKTLSDRQKHPNPKTEPPSTFQKDAAIKPFKAPKYYLPKSL